MSLLLVVLPLCGPFPSRMGWNRVLLLVNMSTGCGERDKRPLVRWGNKAQLLVPSLCPLSCLLQVPFSIIPAIMLEIPLWQGTESGLQPTANKEPRSSVKQPTKFCIPVTTTKPSSSPVHELTSGPFPSGELRWNQSPGWHSDCEIQRTPLRCS